jgi:peptidoglycan/xylan/chitin deacetylase (PgdA/CDA1 family)
MTFSAPRTAGGIRASVPEVSVVIPAFNAADTLDRTLDSLRRQTVQGWEAVIVDDGSSDATAAVAAAAAAADRRFRLLSQRNAGVSAARNAGIAASCGEWLVCLDADDWLAPTYLERMLGALHADPPSQVACCGYARTSTDGAEILQLCPVDYRGDPFACVAQRAMGAIHCYVIRRSLVIEVGGFEPGMRACEDWDLHQRVFRTGARLVQVPEILAFYASRRGSLSRDGARMVADARTVLQRGAGPDPRVSSPDPRYANGRQPDMPIEYSCLWIACWCMAIAIGENSDCPDLLESVGDFTHTEYLGATIFEGLVIGSGLPPRQIGWHWSRFSGPVGALVDKLSRQAGDAGRGRAIHDELVHLMTASDPVTGRRPEQLPERLIVGTTLVVRLAAGMLRHGLAVPPGIDTVLLRVGGRLLQLPVLGPLAAADIRGAVVGLGGDAARRAARAVLRREIAGAAAANRLAHLAAGRLLHVLDGASAAARARPGAATDAGRMAALIREERARILPPQAAAPRQVAASRGGRSMAIVTDQPTSVGGAGDTGLGTPNLPILMYHVIGETVSGGEARFVLSPAGFEQQLSFLRRHGFRAVSLDEWCEVAARGGRFSGRPVMLTFDDATVDFGDTAWPILQRYGFAANVFVPTGKVGGFADWALTGPDPARLMDWDRIVALSAEGVHFGSHLVSHRASNWMTTEDLVREAAASRATLEHRLGREVRGMAFPYGVASQRASRIMRACGYRTALTTDEGIASTYGNMLHVPRIEIAGGDDLAVFARKIGWSCEPADAVEEQVPAAAAGYAPAAGP